MSDGLPPDLEAAVQAIARDREHGALELADRAVAIVESALDRPDTHGALADALVRVRPTMAAIAGAVRHCFDGDPARQTVEARRMIRHGNARAARLLVRDVGTGRVVVTLSRSSACAAALAALAPSCVLVLESRPGREGRTTARRLAARGVDVELVIDAQVGRAVDRADLALIGVDAVLPDGAVINKAGSLPLALAAQRAGIPVYALAHPFKRMLAADATALVRDLERGDPRDAIPDPPTGVRVANHPFEVIPADLITVVTG